MPAHNNNNNTRLLSLQPVKVNEVRLLLSSIPLKSSLLDILPCMLLKSCADVFLQQSSPHLLTCRGSRESFLLVQDSSSVITAEEAQARKFVAGTLQAISNLSTVSKVLDRHIHSGVPARPNHGTFLQPKFMLICHPAAGPTIHQDRLFLAGRLSDFQHCQIETRCHSSEQRLALYFKSRLKTFLFTQTFTEH